ncbi:MAG: membrane protein insertion efficiency factor YidD [Desulfosarcinaceae bacterium]|nr:membrane protein insertion efficiency factor YidD [Desulfosarcinaceae bacterium]
MSPRYRRPTVGLIVATAAILTIWQPMVASAQSSSEHPSAIALSEPLSSPLAQQIGFFRRFLSRADGDRCPMTPSCSTYALQSLRKHGSLKGWVMTCDRLLRCGRDEIHRNPVVREGHRRRIYDPVSNNDFWWWKPPQAAPAAAP